MDNKEEKAKANSEKPKKTEDLNPNMRWYTLQSYAGHEKKVANQIRQRAKANGISDLIEEILIPTQEKIQVSEGKKRKKQEKLYPGYILIKMEITEQSLKVVTNAEGALGFVGPSKKPTPLSPKEVKAIQALSEADHPTYTASFSVNDAVKVVDGPFKDFVGNISEINEDKGQVKVLLSIFGTETPVDLDFLQVSKL